MIAPGPWQGKMMTSFVDAPVSVLRRDTNVCPGGFRNQCPHLLLYFPFFFDMMTYLLVTPIIFFFCMADTTFALKRSEESGA